MLHTMAVIYSKHSNFICYLKNIYKHIKMSCYKCSNSTLLFLSIHLYKFIQLKIFKNYSFH